VSDYNSLKKKKKTSGLGGGVYILPGLGRDPFPNNYIYAEYRMYSGEKNCVVPCENPNLQRDRNGAVS